MISQRGISSTSDDAVLVVPDSAGATGEKHQPPGAGYSLLEVMISMLVLAIAFLALITSQFGAMNGYVSSRDAFEASELGRRTGEILRIQGTQWTVNADTDGDPMTPDTYQGVEPYDSAVPTPFDRTDPIQDVLDAGGGWLPMVDTPVDSRFNRKMAGITDDHLGGKFCIYAKGAEMNQVFQQAGAPVVAALRFQIAVVYPGSRAVLTDCTPAGQIDLADLDAVGDNASAFATFAPPVLETKGYRVSYFGTLVVRRAYLTNFASGN